MPGRAEHRAQWFRRGVIALRDREAAAVIMGVDRVPTRMLTFGTSAGIAGLAGGFML